MTTARKTKSKSKPKKSTKAKAARKAPPKGKTKSGYKRGSLSSSVYSHFDKVGVDEAKYDDVLALAKKIMPKTKFNKYHLSWYKNKYRLAQETK